MEPRNNKMRFSLPRRLNLQTLKMINIEPKTKEVIEYLKNQLMGMRSNRPSPRMVEDIPVEAYGQKMTIKQVGAITILPPAQIQISVWDKSVVNAVAKAVETSNLRVNANIEGTLIRINLPPLSDERRKELIKVVKKEGEEAKIKIRAIREDENKKIGKDFDEGTITEDQKFKFKEDVQKIIDKSNTDVDELVEKKIKEVEE